MKWLWSALGVVVLVVVVAVSGQVGRMVGRGAVEGVQNVTRGDAVVEGLKASAEDVQERLPWRIDEVTVLKTVTAAGRTLTYGYELTRGDYDLDFTVLRSQVTAQVCGNKDMQFALKLGASYIYSYEDAGAILGNFTVTNASC